MNSPDILKQIAYLELISKKNAISCLTGSYLTSIRGNGTEFHEARKYIQGESIRSIDWNMTARLGEPYVKIYREEREREIYIALDISPSMFVGFQEKTKYEVALEIAAGLAYSAVMSDDRLGYIFFQENIIEESKAGTGRKQFFQFLNRGLYYKDNPPPNSKTDIRSVVHSIQKKKGNRFVIFILSDFIDIDIPDDMRYLVTKHDLSLFHIYDRFEYPSENLDLKLYFTDPENPIHSTTSTPGEHRSLLEQEKYLSTICTRSGFGLESFPTHLPYAKILASYFNKRKGRNL